jgi:hypothetical protein
MYVLAPSRTAVAYHIAPDKPEKQDEKQNKTDEKSVLKAPTGPEPTKTSPDKVSEK